MLTFCPGEGMLSRLTNPRPGRFVRQVIPSGLASVTLVGKSNTTDTGAGGVEFELLLTVIVPTKVFVERSKRSPLRFTLNPAVILVGVPASFRPNEQPNLDKATA